MARKPRALRLGDRIGIVAPASAPYDESRYERGLDGLRRLGFQPVEAPHVRSRRGFLAGSDEERVADLHAMFADPTIAGIICLRGGYGATRLLPMLDADLIRNNPKILVGYSDITALNLFLLKECDLVSFYGPMAAVEFAVGPTIFTEACFRRMLTVPEPYGPLGLPRGWALRETLQGGVAEGELVGGCLTLVESLIGTPWQVSLRDKIFFFEDIDAEPYQMDRTLTHLLQAGVLDGVKGIAIGECVGCEHQEGRSHYDNCQTLREVLVERLTPLGVPIVYGVPFGHGTEKATIPLGVRARLDGNTGELYIMESAVVE
ncbi:MAG: peptidase U61 [Candidatus Sumerlaea sp.]|uniref:Muramoyltetrapeptide carboxypeptidase n=1 Tax=Sumerlaea chitinivorans TaxID=2250252 RepID=A0A2Z4Y9Z2_SUMC1|nr:Muramoyltetrapeptide carboxypeptidase [Candidatus Sumerlaea chitinivorans]GIX43697.1 MAG: peptidase U61 [Candidatus Sumerlaea sp.]